MKLLYYIKGFGFINSFTISTSWSISTELLHSVTIVTSGEPTAEETYSLTCTVESNVPPTVQWLYSSNGTAVGTQMTTGSTTTLTLSFNPLHTSHGGLYTCQSTIGTPPSTLTAERNMTVKGEHIASISALYTQL